ncbi:MAG: dihydroorotase, partial [Cytophagaceae bacterium]
IKSITEQMPDGQYEIIESKHLKVSVGWFDMRVSARDPGYEHKDDIKSISHSAAFGGFTGVACLPNTNPPIQSKDVVSYIKSKSQKELVEFFPIAAVTTNLKGEEITEMIDLHHEGAIAFSDADRPIWHSDVFLKTLLYLQKFNGLVINHAEDKFLTQSGLMNEGKVSTGLGLKGMPKLAEELMVERDLKILEYTGGRLHFAHISSPASLELIKSAKKKGLNVTCDIAAYQLALSDASLTSFDTNLKVNPPLRSAADIKYFWKALENDTIDAIVSDHTPQDFESKFLEFDLAEFGMIGLETTFSLVNTYNKGLELDKIIEKLTLAPRRILNLPIPELKEGEIANLTIFDPESEWVFTEKHIKSKSKNTPFVGVKLKGCVLAVINKGQVCTNKEFLEF